VLVAEVAAMEGRKDHSRRSGEGDRYGAPGALVVAFHRP
jgi:hypothetical protein